MNPNGSEVDRLTTDPAADSQEIAFVTARDGNEEIYVMDSEGNNETNRTNNPAPDRGPAWSPGGTEIALERQADIFVVDADDGGNPTNLTADSPLEDTFPNWSPDGSRIAFMSERDGNSHEIWVMDDDGDNLDQLTSDGQSVFNDEPAFSPDGNRIVFEKGQGSGFANRVIYTIDANGDSEVRISADPSSDTDPDWQPLTGTCTIEGDNGDNELNGTPGNDVICGRGGIDTLRGRQTAQAAALHPSQGGLPELRLRRGSGVAGPGFEPGTP